MKKRLWLRLALAAGILLLGLLLVRHYWPPPAYQGKSVKTWALQLSTGDPKARDEAAAAFNAMGTKAVPELVRLLRTRDTAWRRQVWFRAPKLSPAIRRAILTRVRPPDAASVRTAAARALAILGPNAARAVPKLVRALRDKQNRVNWDAAAALGRIGKASVPDLIRALDDSDSQVRETAAYALGEVGPDAAPAVPPLVKMLHDQDQYIRDVAGSSLSKIGAPAMAPLMEILARESGTTRDAAAKALLGYYNPHGPRLSAPAMDETARSRDDAVKVLAGSGIVDETVVRIFAGVLKDSAPEVRLAAVEGLTQAQGNPSIFLNGLVTCLKDESPQVREAAARALGRLGPAAKPAVPRLTHLLDDTDRTVRDAARDALAEVGND